jgi:hypothetical protein
MKVGASKLGVLLELRVKSTAQQVRGAPTLESRGPKQGLLLEFFLLDACMVTYCILDRATCSSLHDFGSRR